MECVSVPFMLCNRAHHQRENARTHKARLVGLRRSLVSTVVQILFRLRRILPRSRGRLRSIRFFYFGCGPAALRLIRDEAILCLNTPMSKLADSFKVEHGKSFRLKDFDPAETGKIHSKEEAAETLQQHLSEMNELQEKLYAQDQWALLLVFQA